MGNWGWGHGKEKSWGNGIIRISLKEAIAVLMAVTAMYGAWKDLKSEVRRWHEEGAEKDAQLEAKLDATLSETRRVADRVTVLETVANETKARVVHISRAPMLSPGVVKITRAR